MKRKKIDRTPERIERFGSDPAWRSLVERMAEALRSRAMTEHDVQEAVKLACALGRVPLATWQAMIAEKKQAAQSNHGADVLPMEDVPLEVTAARSSIPTLWALRHHPLERYSARVALRHWFHVLRRNRA